MSIARQALAFLLVAGIVSVLLAYAGAIVSNFDDGLDRLNLSQALVAPLILAPIYAVFLVAGGLTCGLPALVIMRKMKLASQGTVLVLAGMVVGAVASVVLLGTWLGLAVVPIALGFGAAGGGLSALLWFEFVEKRIAHD